MSGSDSSNKDGKDNKPREKYERPRRRVENQAWVLDGLEEEAMANAPKYDKSPPGGGSSQASSSATKK